ncbi:P-loop containing nucleoside triphosphate hydrolase protein [Athelia psychrophila]|nr:P-loop containing nucleoside triphosphate hydrolase protein [Fibularhizoctonia sp. CBS 109695]
MDEALKLLPQGARIEDVSMSGKLAALSNLLKIIRTNTDEKCILVSHYTSTLNILEEFCKKKSYTYFRLDGQTPTAKRQEYVNIFNKSSQYSKFLFLLSSKAGGVGLNLIGASRLVLIDSDWNPSHDLQAMARIHRDGQKKPVFIYRFLTAGTIDEKIYQRQVTKLGLSNSLMGSGTTASKSDSFSRKDLRDIFRVDPDTSCSTHDLLECPCNGLGQSGLPEAGDVNRALANRVLEATEDTDDSDSESETEQGFMAASQVKEETINKLDKAYLKKKKTELAALGEWTHIDCLRPNARDDVHDDILRKLIYEPEKPAEKVKAVATQTKSRLDALLSAIDESDLTAAEEAMQKLSVHDVPGGTVSFLFEKSSKLLVTSEVDEEAAES